MSTSKNGVEKIAKIFGGFTPQAYGSEATFRTDCAAIVATRP